MNNKIVIHYHSSRHTSASLCFYLNEQPDNLFLSFTPAEFSKTPFNKVKANILTRKSADWSNHVTEEQGSIIKFTYNVIRSINRTLKHFKESREKTHDDYYYARLNTLNLETIDQIKYELPQISKDIVKTKIKEILKNIPMDIREIGLIEKKFNEKFQINYFTSPSNVKLHNLWMSIFDLLSYMEGKGVIRNLGNGRIIKKPISEETIPIADINNGYLFGLNYKSFLYVKNNYTFDETYFKGYSLHHNCVGYVNKILDRLGAGAFVSLKEISKYKKLTTGYSIPENIINYSRLVNNIIKELNQKAFAILSLRNITQTNILDFIKDNSYRYTSYLYVLKNKPDLYKDIDLNLKREIDKYNLFPSHVFMKDSMKILIKLINMSENKIVYWIKSKANSNIFIYYLFAEIHRTLNFISYSEEDYVFYNSNETVSFVISKIKSSYINKRFGRFSNKASLPLAQWVCQRLLQEDIKSKEDILGILSIIILKSQGVKFKEYDYKSKLNSARKQYVETLISDNSKINMCGLLDFTAGKIFFRDLENNLYENTNRSTRFLSILINLYKKILKFQGTLPLNMGPPPKVTP